MYRTTNLLCIIVRFRFVKWGAIYWKTAKLCSLKFNRIIPVTVWEDKFTSILNKTSSKCYKDLQKNRNRARRFQKVLAEIFPDVLYHRISIDAVKKITLSAFVSDNVSNRSIYKHVSAIVSIYMVQTLKNISFILFPP